MTTPRIEERYGLLAEQLAKDVLEELDTKDFQHNPAWDIARKQIEKMIYPKLTKAHQAGIDEAVEKVMPFLKAYKQSLDCDWSLNPVQATNLVYRSPEAVLRDQADAIEVKRKMARDLDDTIKALETKKKDNE